VGSWGMRSSGDEDGNRSEWEFDAREAEKFVEPVEGLERHTQGAAPATQRTGRGVDVGGGCRGTKDGVDHGCAATKSKAHAGFIEQRRLLDRLGCLREWSPTVADDGKAIILLDHIAREVPSRAQLHQGCGCATAHGLNFVGGEDGHGGVHRPGPFEDPNFCSGYGRERSRPWGVTGLAVGFPLYGSHHPSSTHAASRK